MNRAWLLLLMVNSALVAEGCRAGRISRANDELRAKQLELEGKVEDLTARNRELESELERQASRPDSIPLEIREATPHPVKIEIGRLSHARDADGDGTIDHVLVYLHPTDGMGRFTQFVGSIDVHAAVLPPQGDAVTIGRQSLTPVQVREAYRATITGIHYAVEVPVQLTSDVAQAPDPYATVRVVYRDGYTGQSLATERSIKLK